MSEEAVEYIPSKRVKAIQLGLDAAFVYHMSEDQAEYISNWIQEMKKEVAGDDELVAEVFDHYINGLVNLALKRMGPMQDDYVFSMDRFKAEMVIIDNLLNGPIKANLLEGLCNIQQ